MLHEVIENVSVGDYFILFLKKVNSAFIENIKVQTAITGDTSIDKERSRLKQK